MKNTKLVGQPVCLDCLTLMSKRNKLTDSSWWFCESCNKNSKDSNVGNIFQLEESVHNIIMQKESWMVGIVENMLIRERRDNRRKQKIIKNKTRKMKK